MHFGRGAEAQGSVQHTGSDCHRYVDRLIRSSKELMIVSPYVDQYYADILRRSSGGKKVLLISSSIDWRAAKELGRRRHIFIFAALSILLAMLDISELYVNSLTFANLFATVFLIGVLALFLLRGGGNVQLRKPLKFVHMKLYISESQAIQGSANLTYNGMHRNVEHIEIISDPSVINALRKEFMELWKNSEPI